MKQHLKAQASRAIRFATRSVVEELDRLRPPGPATPAAPPPVQIDLVDLVEQLASPRVKPGLVRYFSMNHRWVAQLSERNRRTAVSTYDFIDAEMSHAVFIVDQFKVIASKADEMMELGGQILDLGVYKGASTRSLARIFPDSHIHGFDSFEGLSGDWGHTLKGDFGDVAGALPDVPPNVSLWKGWFEDSLPRWLEEHGEAPISILRIDCDIYSSTKTIFEVLQPLIQPGTWIVFDELIGLRGWEDHEHKAFTEFLEQTGFGYEYVAYGLSYAIARLTQSHDPR